MFVDFEAFFIMVEIGLTIYIYCMFIFMFMGMVLEVLSVGSFLSGENSKKPLLNTIDINKKYDSEEELFRDLGVLFK
jgi:hypothetical protein